MRRLLLTGFSLLLVFTLVLVGCGIGPTIPSDTKDPDYWYGPNYPNLLEPTLGEDLSYFDWGFLLDPSTERLIASGNGWEAYSRGDFSGYSVLFALSDRGIHSSSWKDRLVEVYPDHCKEIVVPEFPGAFLMDARKYSDGTYSYVGWETGIWHVDSEGNILHKYLDEVNGHESLILDDGKVLSYSFFHGIARITDWEGNVYWEWDQGEEIERFDEDNYSNIEFHYGTSWDSEGNLILGVYDPLQVVKENQDDGGLGLNRVQVLENGHKLISLRNADLVIEVDQDNKVVWSFGPMVLRHQHCPTLLDNGNILIHDTGNNRAIEVTRDHEIVWAFYKGMVCPYMGMVQRLEDGNTVISDGLRTVAYCVTPEGEVLWEVYIKGKDTLTRSEVTGKVLPGFRIYRAWTYPIN